MCVYGFRLLVVSLLHIVSSYNSTVVVMAVTNKDVVLVVSLVLSLVSLVLLFGVTWYFQSSLDLLQQQVEYDRELLLKLQEQVNVRQMGNVYVVYNL